MPLESIVLTSGALLAAIVAASLAGGLLGRRLRTWREGRPRPTTSEDGGQSRSDAAPAARPSAESAPPAAGAIRPPDLRRPPPVAPQPALLVAPRPGRGRHLDRRTTGVLGSIAGVVALGAVLVVAGLPSAPAGGVLPGVATPEKGASIGPARPSLPEVGSPRTVGAIEPQPSPTTGVRVVSGGDRGATTRPGRGQASTSPPPTGSPTPTSIPTSVPSPAPTQPVSTSPATPPPGTPTPAPTAPATPPPTAAPTPRAVVSFRCDAVGLTVTCTNETPGAGSWAWSLGDGATSSKRNPPAHTYAGAGTYTVRLTLTRDGASMSAERAVSVSDGS